MVCLLQVTSCSGKTSGKLEHLSTCHVATHGLVPVQSDSCVEDGNAALYAVRVQVLLPAHSEANGEQVGRTPAKRDQVHPGRHSDWVVLAQTELDT